MIHWKYVLNGQLPLQSHDANNLVILVTCMASSVALEGYDHCVARVLAVNKWLCASRHRYKFVLSAMDKETWEASSITV